MDMPIAHTADGRPLYDNTPTVVILLVGYYEGLIVVRRNNEPGKGLLGLPGGYHMRGETWQQAGARELYEETGLVVNPDLLHPVHVMTDEYGNNLIFATQTLNAIGPIKRDPKEVQEVLILKSIPPVSEWAFPTHHAQALRIL